MGTIEVIGKYNLTEGKWIFSPNLEDYGRSFAFGNYDKIINNENEGIDYIFIDQGSRVEGHSKDYKSIEEKEVRMDNVLEYYKNKNGNCVAKLLLMDADAPIIEDAKLFARYIDNIAALSNTNSINIIGLSKCGAMNFHIPQFFKNPKSCELTNMYSIATPYEGTKMASPLIFYPEVKRLVVSKIGDNCLSNKIYTSLINIYEGISSNSHMDYDIAIPNGIPENKFNAYDPMFIPNLLSSNNVEAVKRLKIFRNFITGIDDKTLKEAIRTRNTSGIGLCILNDWFFDKKSDGMVYTASQRIVEDYIDTKSIRLESTHHDVNSNIRAFSKVFDIVNDDIEENKELKRCRILH